MYRIITFYRNYHPEYLNYPHGKLWEEEPKTRASAIEIITDNLQKENFNIDRSRVMLDLFDTTEYELSDMYVCYINSSI